MKSRLIGGVVFLLGTVWSGLAFAAVENLETIDCGGQRVSSANYTLDGSLGGIPGVASNAAAGLSAWQGYIGQLAEVSQLVVSAPPAVVNEGSALQLGGVATLPSRPVMMSRWTMV